MSRVFLVGLVAGALACATSSLSVQESESGSGGSCDFLLKRAERAIVEGNYEVAWKDTDTALRYNSDDADVPAGPEACYPVRVRARVMYELAEAEWETSRDAHDKAAYEKMAGECERVLAYLGQSQKGDEVLEVRVKERIRWLEVQMRLYWPALRSSGLRDHETFKGSR